MWAALASILGSMVSGRDKGGDMPKQEQKQQIPISSDFANSDYGGMIKQAMAQKQSGQFGM